MTCASETLLVIVIFIVRGCATAYLLSKVHKMAEKSNKDTVKLPKVCFNIPSTLGNANMF